MNLLSIRKCSWTMSGVFAACLTFAAHGSTNVFNDAVFWFRGGKDRNNDGYIQQGEFFDDLHANDASHENHQMPMSTSLYTGDSVAFKGNAVLQNETVVFPALGTSKEMKVLHISCLQAAGKYYFPYDVNPYSIFANNSISNEYTVVSRIKIDDDGINREECLFRIGYDTSDRKGLYLALGRIAAPGGGFDKFIKGYFTPDSASSSSSHTFSIRIPTNTWVDVAAVVGNGKLRIGIAAPESSPDHDNNPTIAFAQTPMWTDNCTLLGDGKYRLFCLEGQTTYKIANEMDQTAFIGSVQQLAIWGRALSDQEVMAAFGMPRPAIFRTGFDNGCSNEFGGTRSGSTQTIDGLGSWQNIANAMQAGDIWTVNFNALRDEANLPQIFSIKSLSSSSTALIEPILNGTSLGEGRIAANSRVFWPVATNLVRNGVNELVIKRKDARTRDFLIDAMELGGSLGVGTITKSSTDDGRVDPERIKTGVPSAADPNTQHWPTKLEPSTGIKDLHFRVWIDPDVADKASFTLKTAAKCDAISSSEKFSPYVNGDKKGDVSATNDWKQLSLSFNAGDLQGGWNDIDFYSTASRCWEFGYYRFETVLPSPVGFSMPPALTIVIR
ncbi:MAG: hypothetical protein IKU71_06025 [Kiritimatiellae bacterium]|nr:hypothetical protein [Kiritimatiellia bacterium]